MEQYGDPVPDWGLKQMVGGWKHSVLVLLVQRMPGEMRLALGLKRPVVAAMKRKKTCVRLAHFGIPDHDVYYLFLAEDFRRLLNSAKFPDCHRHTRPTTKR